MQSIAKTYAKGNVFAAPQRGPAAAAGIYADLGKHWENGMVPECMLFLRKMKHSGPAGAEPWRSLNNYFRWLHEFQ